MKLETGCCCCYFLRVFGCCARRITNATYCPPLYALMSLPFVFLAFASNLPRVRLVLKLWMLPSYCGSVTASGVAECGVEGESFA